MVRLRKAQLENKSLRHNFQHIFSTLTLVTITLGACVSVGKTPDLTQSTDLAPVGSPPALTPDSVTTELQQQETKMKISTSAFADGQPIPKRFTCSGDNSSPELTFESIPTDAKSLALIMDDPDAPSGTFVHWVVYNIPPTLTGLPEKLAADARLSGVGSQGPTSFGRAGYGGPCPPVGKVHHYYFKLYAINLEPTLQPGLDRNALLKQMEGHILAQAQWMGTYQR